MQELERELEAAQRTASNAHSDNRPLPTNTREHEVIDTGRRGEQVVQTTAPATVNQFSDENNAYGTEQSSEIQIAGIGVPKANVPGVPSIEDRSLVNESIISGLRVRLIKIITSLKADLSAIHDSDTEKAALLISEIEKLESTFEEIESIAAEQLEREKSRAELL